jgi:hypothetical protein
MPEHDTLAALEEGLRRLRPALPPAALEQAIARRIQPEPHAAQVFWFPIQLAAAACLAGLAGAGVILAERDTSGPAAEVAFTPPRDAPALFRPVSSTQYLYEALEEGIVETSDGQPLRRVRTRSWETVAYKGESGDLEIRVPREDILYLPLPTY